MSRLIDADKLKRRVQSVATEAWKMKLEAKVETTLNQFLDYVEQAPTIDAVDIKAIYDAGYSGKEVRFRIGGRLFAVRELPQ